MNFIKSNTKSLRLTKVNLINLALLLVVISLPWSEKFNTYCIGFLLLTTIYLLYFSRAFSKNQLKKFILGSIVFFVSVIWLLNTENITEGLYYLERTSSGILFPLIFLIIPSKLIRKNLVLKGFVISVFCRYLYMLLVKLDYELIFIPDYWLEFLLQLNQLYLESDLHPTYFSVFVGFAALFSLHYFFNNKNKLLWFLVFLSLTIFNLTLAAKMPLAAYFIILFGYFTYQILSFKKGKKRNIRLALVALAGSILLIGLVKIPNFILQDVYNYYNLLIEDKQTNVFDFDKLGNRTDFDIWEKTNRVFIWATATKVICNNWWIGVGTGDVNDELNSYYLKNGLEYHQRKNTNTHSQPLDFLLRFGILGTLLIVLAFILFFKVIKINNYVLYGIFMFFFVVAFLTENLLNRQLGIVFFHFFNNFFITTAVGNVEMKKVTNNK